ncbi:hypothetical protein KC865_01905 [Candidatus Kaiserbacteria bacterium]|nr:hypothetical protein [Candidatus Kaiserbacteria bacterium]USN92220.1 MAG: hypothetical protein H6782_00095 [Candidatus Nomurabacteria bacterium]
MSTTVTEIWKRIGQIADVHVDRHFVIDNKTHSNCLVDLSGLTNPENTGLLREVAIELFRRTIAEGRFDTNKAVMMVGTALLDTKLVELMREINESEPMIESLVPAEIREEKLFVGSDLVNSITPETQVILVQALLQEIKSVNKTIGSVIRPLGSGVRAISSIIDQSGLEADDFGVPFVIALRSVEVLHFDLSTGTCPLCSEGRPIVKNRGQGEEHKRHFPKYKGGYIDL